MPSVPGATSTIAEPTGPQPIVRDLGRADYEPVWRAMQRFTDERGPDTPDEIWMLEHDPVFTLGQAGKREHVLAPGDIPVLPVDRGGQVTYHGPGQIVAYPLLDLRRLGIGVRALVSLLEQSIIDLLAEENIVAVRRESAPGVYVDGAKIAALGLRVRRGSSFHGLAFNVDMDLEPFSRINPCGFEGLEVTQWVEKVRKGASGAVALKEVKARLLRQLLRHLGYNEPLSPVHDNPYVPGAKS